jgi:hypothetical protein
MSQQEVCQPPDLTTCCPTTVTTIHGHLLSSPSADPFPQPTQLSTEVSQWDINPIPPPFIDTPPFFQRLIGYNPPTAEECEQIREEVQDNSLLACSDGSHCPAKHVGSHS